MPFGLDLFFYGLASLLAGAIIGYAASHDPVNRRRGDQTRIPSIPLGHRCPESRAGHRCQLDRHHVGPHYATIAWDERP